MSGLGLLDDLSHRWNRLSAGWRLLVGTAIVILVSFVGLTPKSIFGISIAWPFAALWAAVGWGLSGVAIRPLILLTIFGLFQDVASEGPLGCFMVVFITVYGLSALAGENFDFNADPLRRGFVAPIAMGFGFFILWVISSGHQEYRVAVGTFIGPFLTTIVSYLAVSWAFRLRPDRLRGL